MRVFVSAAFVCILSAAGFSCKKEVAPSMPVSQKIIVVVMDGARYSETWGDSAHTHIPRLHSLASQGCVFTKFYKQDHTYTCSGHAEILTGVDQAIDNGGNELPQYPSFMQYGLLNSEVNTAGAWIVASKDKLHVLTDCQETQLHGQFKPHFFGGVNGAGTGYCHDSITIKRVETVMNDYAPDFLLVNFREPDYSGHAGDSIGYLKGIRYVDSCFNLIYTWAQSLPDYAGKTTILLTNDHGRHLDSLGGYTAHGDGCEGCRHIFLFAAGPHFKTSTVITNTYYLRDIAATVAYLKQLQMPHSQGNVIHEIFK